MKAGGVVEVDERPVPVDLHPVDGARVLRNVAVGHPVPVDVHRPGHAGRVLDERIGRRDEHDHRRAAPAAGAAPSATGSARDSFRRRSRPHRRTTPARPPRRSRRPRRGRRSGTARTAPSESPRPRTSTQTAAYPALRERVGALGGALSAAPVRGAHHHGRRRPLAGQHEIGGKRDPVPHRDPDVEAAGEAHR